MDRRGRRCLDRAVGLALGQLLGEGLGHPAEQLGVATEVHKRWLLAATALMVGAAVSVAGLVTHFHVPDGASIIQLQRFERRLGGTDDGHENGQTDAGNDQQAG